MSRDLLPRPADDVLRHASRALGKVDLWGRRGVTMLSMDEVEAMAVLLFGLGLIPTPPGTPVPDQPFNTPLTEA